MTIAMLPWGRRTVVMGVLNLTPDSFSDGGRHQSPEAAAGGALTMVRQGADVLDLGGQSTRPGAEEIPPEVERQRVLPALERIVAALGSEPALRRADPGGPLISVDTFWSGGAEAALAAGAHWINDVSGGRRDPAILRVAAAAGCPYVLRHSRGTSRSMDGAAVYDDVVEEVRQELMRATDRALAAGIAAEQLIWDPGLGFAKTPPQNITLLRGLGRLRAEGFPLLVGPSRKRFIGEVLGEPRPRARLWGTAAVCAQAIGMGADILRVHDVGPIVQTARMAEAVLSTQP